MIHVAVLNLREPNEDGEEEMVFASLDGQDYLPVTRVPVAGDEKKIATMFEPDEKGFINIRFARRAMDAWWWGDRVTEAHHFTVVC